GIDHRVGGALPGPQARVDDAEDRRTAGRAGSQHHARPHRLRSGLRHPTSGGGYGSEGQKVLAPFVLHTRKKPQMLKKTDRLPNIVRIMAASAGVAAANLYYAQPLLPQIGAEFDIAQVVGLLPAVTQIG